MPSSSCRKRTASKSQLKALRTFFDSMYLLHHLAGVIFVQRLLQIDRYQVVPLTELDASNQASAAKLYKNLPQPLPLPGLVGALL